VHTPVSNPSTKRAYAKSTNVVHLVATVTTFNLYFFTFSLTTTTQDEKFLASVSFLTLIKKKDTHTHTRSMSSAKYLPAYAFLVQLTVSTPIVVLLVHVLEAVRDVELWQTLNSYVFSSAMCLLWLYPFVWPGCGSLYERATMATQYWHWFLAGIVVVLFQSLHNWGAPLLHAQKGLPLAWPFEAYALSDSRWIEFNGGRGLPEYVYAINCNDVLLSLVTLIFTLVERVRLGSFAAFSPLVAALALFRDATMWRETVEYLWDHHHRSYPWTTTSPTYRPHAIANLYLVNAVWILGPMVNVWVTVQTIKREIARAKDLSSTKKRN